MTIPPYLQINRRCLSEWGCGASLLNEEILDKEVRVRFKTNAHGLRKEVMNLLSETAAEESHSLSITGSFRLSTSRWGGVSQFVVPTLHLPHSLGSPCCPGAPLQKPAGPVPCPASRMVSRVSQWHLLPAGCPTWDSRRYKLLPDCV